jgi:hypothetical protein
MTTTTARINLRGRSPYGGTQYGMSASSAPADRVAAFRATSGTAWLAGRFRARQQHRAEGDPAPVRRAVLVVAAAIAWVAVTLFNIGREYGAHAAAMGCLVIAAATVSDTLGWAAAGLAIMWTQHLSRTAGQAPPSS